MHKKDLVYNWIFMSLFVDFVNRCFWMSQFNWTKEFDVEQFEDIGLEWKQAFAFSPAKSLDGCNAVTRLGQETLRIPDELQLLLSRHFCCKNSEIGKQGSGSYHRRASSRGMV